MFRVRAHVLFDLHHEFTGRRNHQRAHATPLIIPDGSSQLRQNGENECGRLPRAGLRDPDEIVPGQNVRDRGHLNRSRLGIAGFLHGFENLRGKIKSAKWHKPGTIVPSAASASLILLARLCCRNERWRERPPWRPIAEVATGRCHSRCLLGRTTLLPLQRAGYSAFMSV